MMASFFNLCLFWSVFCTDPDINRGPLELIASKGYTAEHYQVITKDGYKLTMHRIPCSRAETGTPSCSRPRPVVFLQHGLICSSTNWLTNLANESFAYLLADAGFDVFLGNNRGNAYSLAHVSLKPDQTQFWNFSMDEFAKYDLPAMVDSALAISGQSQLYYIGHSQGTMIGFIQFGVDKELASKIKHFYALGPVATVKYIKGLLRPIAPFTKELSIAFKLFGVKDFLPNNWVFKLLAKTVCTEWLTNPLCKNTLFLIAGYDSSQMNSSRIPVYVSHSPSGTSAMDVVHFGQLVNSKKFQKFDFGEKENRKRYGTDHPPEYNPALVDVPVTLYVGEEDWLATEQDVKDTLLPNLKNITGYHLLKETNHLDFLWGLRVIHDVYKPIIQDLKQKENM